MISPYVRRLRLAAELRALRMHAGVTHVQLAKQIGQSRAQISRLENGHVVDQDDVMKILDALGVDDDRWTEIMTIAREAGERGWWESNRFMGERQALYANLEAGAQTIREFQMTFIPGLLQTPEFTRARNEADRLAGAVTFNADKAADGRVGRQRMLRRPGGPGYEVIIDELAIRRADGAARGAEGAALPHRGHGQRQPQDHVAGAAGRRRPSTASACPARRSRSTRSAIPATRPSSRSTRSPTTCCSPRTTT